MAEPGMDDEDLFADLYDGDDTANDAPAPVVKPEVDPQDAADAAAAAADDFLSQQQAEPVTETNESNGFKQEQSYDQDMGGQQNEFREPEPDNRPLIGSKEDGAGPDQQHITAEIRALIVERDV